MNARSIAFGIMGRPRRSGRGWLVLCPDHADRNPSLSVCDGENGRILLKCHAGCSYEAIRGALTDLGLWAGSTTLPKPPETFRPVNRMDILNAIYEGTRPFEPGGVCVRYLAGREILLTEWPRDLREHADLELWEDGRSTGKRFPGMVSVIRDVQGQPAGLHLTFLETDESSKAPVESPRRIIGMKDGSTRGGCVRLLEPREENIGLAEGIETALSAFLLTGVPMWAALNAGGIERTELPQEIRRVTIFADHDKTGTGLKSALKAYDRLTREGRMVEIRQPRRIGDYNDELKKEARMGVLA